MTPLKDDRVSKYIKRISRSNTADLRRDELQRERAVEFGRRRGWVLMPRGFEAPPLYFPATDHRQYYGRRDELTGSTRLKPIAFTAILYDGGPKRSQSSLDAIAEYADQNGLVAELPDFPSWRLPGSSTLVVYQSKSGSFTRSAIESFQNKRRGAA